MVPDQAEASGRPELEDQAEARDRAELEDQAEARGARIEARGLSRSFGPHQALCDLDLEIGRGEAFGLLGANGAGKTTFIRLVTGYLIPSAGAIQVDGYSPTFDAAEVSRRIGFVAENAFIYRELRVEGFLRFAAGLRGLAGRDLHLAVRSSLERFHLTDVSRRLIGNLSKGFRQRVALAQAFLHDPSLLIVDEPTSGLDPLQQAEVREVIKGLRGRRTVLLCTHDLAEARELTSRVAILHQGRLVQVGPTDVVLGGDDPLALFSGRTSA